MKHHEGWAPPFLPLIVKCTKVHPKGNRNSDKQGASTPKTSQENKGFQEQGDRNDLDVMTPAIKSRTGLPELGRF